MSEEHQGQCQGAQCFGSPQCSCHCHQSEERDKRLEEWLGCGGDLHDPAICVCADIRSLLADYRAAVAANKRWEAEEITRASNCCGQEERAERAEAENAALRAEREELQAQLDIANSTEAALEHERTLRELADTVVERDRLREWLNDALTVLEAPSMSSNGAKRRLAEKMRRALAGESRAEEPAQ